MASLAAVAGGLVAAPALAANFGNEVYNCYGIWWNTDWNQECDFISGGAERTGTYQTIADCTAPQIPDKSVTIYRYSGSLDSADGPDCAYGIHSATTWFW